MILLEVALAAVALAGPQYDDANPYNKPPPVGTDPDFDCMNPCPSRFDHVLLWCNPPAFLRQPVFVAPGAWRKAAFAYAKKIQPESRQMAAIHDSLQLSTCGESRPTTVESTATPNRHLSLPRGGNTIYVAPDGSDSATGTEAAPLASVHAAVNKLRGLGGSGNTVVLRAGVRRLG